MNLTELSKWANEIDVKKVPVKRQERVECYIGMIHGKIKKINELTKAMDDSVENLNEYVLQLDRIGVKFKEGLPIHDLPPVKDGDPQETTESAKAASGGSILP